ncbi:MAG: sulfite exporter TauE/SafE family protein [Aquificae bacterium]|nr:sulfite exporter TauE/SafE family protein [Aquificota bacterium]
MEIFGFLWGVVVGAVFSTVGAAGGLLAGFGHITLFGIGSANSVKVMNQFLVLVSTLVSVPNYWRHGRLIVILGILLGTGSVLGALIGSTLSYKYLTEMSKYKFFFGLFTLLVAFRILYEVLYKERERVKEIDRGIREGAQRRVKVVKRSAGSVVYTFLGKEHVFNPVLALFAGFFVALISSALGVGGGFLLVPFMVSVLKVPMYLVPGTSALSVLITSVVSILNYLKLGASVKWSFLAFEAVGVVIGSFLGPYISHALGERRLRLLLGFILLGIGVKYIFI